MPNPTDSDLLLATKARRHTLLLFWLSVALTAILAVIAIQKRVPVWSPTIPLCAAACLARRHGRLRDRWWRLVRLRHFYDAPGRSTGEEFRRPGHVYDADLHILGPGSLFELVCTARTGIGRRKLAEYLLNPCSLDESRARQAAVRELKPQVELRERIALLGRYDFQESTWSTFAEWMALPAATAPGALRIAALLCSALVGILVLAAFTTAMPLAILKLYATPAFAVEMAIAWYFRSRTVALNAAARRVGVEIAVVREGVELIATLKPQCPMLLTIQRQLADSGASQSLKRLERLTNALAECDKPYFDLASQALIARTQICFAIEAWKFRHAAALGAWLNAWGEFEALTSISGYAWQRVDDPFPLLEDGPPAFKARNLRHPLISAENCVGNDVALGPQTRFYIVSGSNMSGKSTLMRSIGLNVVLAKAGAPVTADSLRLTDLEVFASLSIVDSVLDGKSKFLAEVDRIRLALERAREAPVLFLIDEILSGTNSPDRRIATESIVRTLIEFGAIGILSTHDLALTEIAEPPELLGANLHMGSRSPGDAMDFDYLLKPGITSESNALAIAAMMGVCRN